MKVLDLRKKPSKTPKTLQKTKEVVKTVLKTKSQQRSKPDISWDAPSFYYNPQKRYLSLLIIALLVGAGALLIFKHDTLTSIFLILSSLVLVLYGSQKPTISNIIVNQKGVSVDDMVYPYKDLKSFWIEYNPGGPKELSLESSRWYIPYIKVLLGNQNPVELRSLMINFLPEQEHENSLVSYLGKKIGL